MSRLDCKIPPPITVILAGILNLGSTAYSATLFEPPWILISVLGISSGIFGIGGISACIRRGTTIHPWSPNKTEVLVTNGVFRFTRNPMYLSLVLLLSAYYFLQPTPFSPFGLLGTLWFLTRFQIVPEERVLAEKFGHVYLQYKQTTRRWF
ncbi:MAG TPA: isoprenylcysteine carboxylmethyltransferase family protein [Gammaproteobacteria bacterium]|nr:protein-S-isoprenylcysteine methyltransferase [Gammaproteobacteria bacterium]HBX26057.1 isoprenylcysteine carboxylmethyltransferase family protein [Gammaproteobacteria bacterium]